MVFRMASYHAAVSVPDTKEVSRVRTDRRASDTGKHAAVTDRPCKAYRRGCALLSSERVRWQFWVGKGESSVDNPIPAVALCTEYKVCDAGYDADRSGAANRDFWPEEETRSPRTGKGEASIQVSTDRSLVGQLHRGCSHPEAGSGQRGPDSPTSQGSHHSPAPDVWLLREYRPFFRHTGLQGPRDVSWGPRYLYRAPGLVAGPPKAVECKVAVDPAPEELIVRVRRNE